MTAPSRMRFQPGRRAGGSGAAGGGPFGGSPDGPAGVPPRGGDGEPGRRPLRGEVVTLTGRPMIGAIADGRPPGGENRLGRGAEQGNGLLSHLSGRAADPDALALERLGLGFRRALGA